MNWKAERKRIRRIGKKWRHVLALYEWDLTTHFVDGPLIVDGTLAPDAAGCASVDWQYRHADVSFNLEKTAKLTDTKLEEVYLHEMMHVLLHEMREHDPELKHEERVASTLAFAFMRTRKGV